MEDEKEEDTLCITQIQMLPHLRIEQSYSAERLAPFVAL
jgi:hypothetical protein